MDTIGAFPFGQPIHQLSQKDRTQKRVFVLGVYASAVHARWVGDDGRQKIAAVAVASEPEIFWQGSPEAARSIISAIKLPEGAGRLEPANANLNGPSGKALDQLFLHPLGLTRGDAWLCDLVPHSCMNEKQALALQRAYDPMRATHGLLAYDWPLLPGNLADERRRAEIESEILQSEAAVVITLGDLPLKWFTQHHGTANNLLAYGQTAPEYGRLHPFCLAGRKLNLLPLVHPRQAGRLGAHSAGWAGVHEDWVANRPLDLGGA